MKQFFLYLWLLTKRLYKKPAFLAILLLIPLLVLSFGAAAKQESGVVTVSVYATDPRVEPMLESQLMRYIPCPTEKRAEELVRYGKADMAWIFPEELDRALETFCSDPSSAKPVVQVLQREDSALLRLAREKLSGMLTVLASPALYERFARENGLADLDTQELMAFYEGAAPEMDLFHFSDLDTAAPVTYLTAPVRGLLAVVLVLAGLAMAMFFTGDLQKGTFAAIPLARLPLVEAGCQLICLVNVGVVTLAALTLSGMAALSLRELAVMALYVLCCGSFAMLLRAIFPANGHLGACLTALTVAMVGICPVFFDLASVQLLQLLLPPTYYILGLHSNAYLGGMVLYALLCLLLRLPLSKR